MQPVDTKFPARPQTIKATARLIGQNPAQVRKALKRKEIRTVHWAGRDWIPATEIIRLRKMLHEGNGQPSEDDKPPSEDNETSSEDDLPA